MKLLVLVVAILIAVPGCHPSGAASPSDGGVCALACADLRAAGCTEGNPSAGGEACETTCARVIGALDVTCIIAAPETPAGMRGCNVRCE